MIYNDGYKLDSNGRAIRCPRCDNEELNYEGKYCTICGTYLINRYVDKTDTDINGDEFVVAEGCGIVPGNARYCPSCGNETTFFRAGLLKYWEDALEEESKPPF